MISSISLKLSYFHENCDRKIHLMINYLTQFCVLTFNRLMFVPELNRDGYKPNKSTTTPIIDLRFSGIFEKNVKNLYENGVLVQCCHVLKLDFRFIIQCAT